MNKDGLNEIRILIYRNNVGDKQAHLSIRLNNATIYFKEDLGLLEVLL